MLAFLTSSIGGSYKFEGRRIPIFLMTENKLLNNIKENWNKDSKVLILSASPNEYELNDSIVDCQREAFKISDLSYSSFEICDNRNTYLLENINEFDVIILAGGHVPTQNEFFTKIDLKNKLIEFDGLLIAWSAGTMNSAEIVYAQPELEGEGISENYQRFIQGLGLTKTMIIPHFQDIKNDILDGLKVMEDITLPDSIGKEFIALNDGSYILSKNGEEYMYGDAFLIKDGKINQICTEGQILKVCN